MLTILKPPLLTKPFNLLPAPPAGCVLWLPGQDDAYSATIRDRSGSGNHGAITGATWVRHARGLWVQSFDGDDDINCGTGSSLDIFSNTKLATFLLWFKRTNVNQAGYLFSKSAGTGSEGFHCKVNADNTVTFTTGGVKDYTSTFTIANTNWNHLGMVYDSGFDVSFYLNGAFQETVLHTVVGKASSTSSFRWGVLFDLSAGFRGHIGLPCVCNVVLSATVIANSFNQTRHLFKV